MQNSFVTIASKSWQGSGLCVSKLLLLILINNQIDSSERVHNKVYINKKFPWIK